MNLENRSDEQLRALASPWLPDGTPNSFQMLDPVKVENYIADRAARSPVTYRDGEIIEYTSFDPAGWSIGQVVRYAPASEQTRTCPNCDQLAVPGEGDEGSLRQCPRCRALCQFPALNPLVYIRTRSGGKPFPVRETQLRRRPGARRNEVYT